MRRSWLLGPALLAGLVMAADNAQACGGCFAPPETVTELDSHRMVVALSPTQTTLWDQIQYQGNPSEFVWVLPVPSEQTVVDLAEGSFFDQLEEQTAPRIFAPPSSNRFGGCGRFAGAPTADASNGGGQSENVMVFHQGVVGPYQTATIGSQDPSALRNWLISNGYSVPESTLPVIAHYVGLGNVFVALKLRPNVGIQQMQPVRVTYPGYMARFPLKMVAVGAASAVKITLWVISEQRTHAMNFPDALIDFSKLTWDSSKNASNYSALFNDAVARAGGRGFVTEAAMPLSNLYFYAVSPDEDPTGDVTVARAGQRAPYLTRLRSTLYTTYLDQDLILAPSAQTANVQTNHTAVLDLNPPAPVVCPNDPTTPASGQPSVRNPFAPWDGEGGSADRSAGCSTSAGHGPMSGLTLGLLLVGLALVIARRRRRG
ncbi:MAG: DUF2330 domain-containing protein [Deltaproteobacteria bacterium]|nr:DUF2330 domain-containing protein [Deltaproteobacteria bacterium]